MSHDHRLHPVRVFSMTLWLMTLVLMPAELTTNSADANEIRTQDVRQAIDQGRRFLFSVQQEAGNFPADGVVTHPIGSTAVATLALLKTGSSKENPDVQRAMNWLRSPRNLRTNRTHEVSLLLMTFSAYGDSADRSILELLAQRLCDAQHETGEWPFEIGRTGGDPDISQFAALGLRDAAQAGITISGEVWERTEEYWKSLQNADGSWGEARYDPQQVTSFPTTSRLTLAGVSTLALCQQMKQFHRKLDEQNFCEPVIPDEAFVRGVKWLELRFGHHSGPERVNRPESFVNFHLYGVERGGRSSGQLFFGEYDWYFEGAAALIRRQNPDYGSWPGNNTTISTSYSMLSLASGLSPTLISKLKHGRRDPSQPLQTLTDDWNHYPNDVWNLTHKINSLPDWPSLLTSHEVDLYRLTMSSGINHSFLQTPVLFISAETVPEFIQAEINLLRTYLQQGGFVVVCPGQASENFQRGMHELVSKLFPGGTHFLNPLPAGHPVYRNLDGSSKRPAPLLGVEMGCRTGLIYCPVNLACGWQQLTTSAPLERDPDIQSRIDEATQLGLNLIAYATGRTAMHPLDYDTDAEDSQSSPSQRGELQIGQVQHGGNWSLASGAIPNLAKAVQQKAGVAVSSTVPKIPLNDPAIFECPLLVMQGDRRFRMSAEELKHLRDYLDRGGMLFASACCASSAFDQSFRETAARLYPHHQLSVIPVDHDLYSAKMGNDVRQVRYNRISKSSSFRVSQESASQEEAPYLEGIEVDGKLVVIYSKYDMSCALESPGNSFCNGYVPEDALKLAVNIVMYSMLQ